MAKTVRVFDPPMCCSTGVCGPSVDPKLVRFAADLEWLAAQGVSVERFNLTHSPAMFAGTPVIRDLLHEKGDAALPAVLVDGEIASAGGYPDREALARLAGLEPPPLSLMSDSVSELVAIGASIASNCEPCFRFHYDKARRLGVSCEDMLRAVRVAQAVKETPAKSVLGLAERYLGAAKHEEEASQDEAVAAGACCSAPGPVSIRPDDGSPKV